MERGYYIKLSIQIPSKRLVQTGGLIDQLYYNPSGQNKCAAECRLQRYDIPKYIDRAVESDIPNNKDTFDCTNSILCIIKFKI